MSATFGDVVFQSKDHFTTFILSLFTSLIKRATTIRFDTMGQIGQGIDDFVSILKANDEIKKIGAAQSKTKSRGEDNISGQRYSEEAGSLYSAKSPNQNTRIISKETSGIHINKNGDSHFSTVPNSNDLRSITTAKMEEKITERDLKLAAKNIKQEDIEYIVKHDLTKEGIESISNGVPIEISIELIKSKFGPQSLPFTSGEKSDLKKAVKSQVHIDDLCNALPFRSRDEINSRMKDYEFLATRKTKFKNAQEKLVYEAKWLLMENSGTQSSRRKTYRTNIDEIEKAASSISTHKKKSHILSEEERQERRKKYLRRMEEKKEQRLKRALELQQRQKERQLNPQKIRKPSKTMAEKLQEATEYFQSIAGDRQPIGEGTKRRRLKASHYSPPVETVKRTNYNKSPPSGIEVKKSSKKVTAASIKGIKVQKKEKKPPKVAKQAIKNKNKKADLFPKGTKDKAQSTENTKAGKEKDTVEMNPFDPSDIIDDSNVPLHGRRFYVDEIYSENPHLPQLNFAEEKNDELLLDESEKFPHANCLAKSIIEKHIGRYRDMPTSFPPLRIVSASTGVSILNPNNIINIRFLLYPQHYEQFILAEPKSNELDPVFEIKKLFEMHYSLYFSHSPKLKKIIVSDYCTKLLHSVEENSFVDFMFVVDKWNKLMIELSPNFTENKDQDLNDEVRKYLIHDSAREPSLEDIRLDIFFDEINNFIEDDTNDTIEPPSPNYDIVERKTNTILTPAITPPLSSNEDEKENTPSVPKRSFKLEEPENLKYSEINPSFQKPRDYIRDFYKHLKLKKSISRFTVQQVFLRVYSRIVSTDSKKLRSYKAFTAEVYGELLPSFTSEVLTKVDLRPHQSFYDLGSGVGNTTFQAALEFGAKKSGGCELMKHASHLTRLQERLIQKNLALFGIQNLNLDFALHQSFVDNDKVKNNLLESDIIIVNNYLFDAHLNAAVGKLLFGVKPGTKIISLKNFISPRYKFSGDNTVFDYLKVEKHEMEHNFSVSWTWNKVPYYISTVQDKICPEYS